MSDADTIQQHLADERIQEFRVKFRTTNILVSIVAPLLFFLWHGEVFPHDWDALFLGAMGVCIIALVIEPIGVYAQARSVVLGFRNNVMDSIILGLLLGAGVFLALFSTFALGALDTSTTRDGLYWLIQASVIAMVGARMLRLFNFLTHVFHNPMLMFVGTFAAICTLGGLLLMLPGATVSDTGLGPIDAMFMAVSATCVTGLSVVDVGQDLTLFGQIVLLSMIQIGGLGIMTFAAFFGMFFGRGMGVKHTAAMGEVLNVDLMGRVGRLTTWIFGITFISEGLGVWILYGGWRDATGVPLPAEDQLYYSVFHSISAFCNAGFSLFSDSMIEYADQWPTVLGISALVVVGGLGFAAVQDLLSFRFWAHPAFRRVRAVRMRLSDRRLPRLSIQTKIVVTTTALLLGVGIAGFMVLEWDGVLAGKSFGDALAISIFHGMTPRTAGFNSADVGAFKPVTQYFTMLLMVIGASPGGTGGGLKTTTFVVMFVAVLATVRGRDPEVLKRRLPDGLIRKALVMLCLTLAFINVATLLLMLTESAGIGSEQLAFEKISFEVVSAFATVGLSTGITTELTPLGRIIIMACMFAGRVGPLSMVLAVGRRHVRPFQYPEENIMIG